MLWEPARTATSERKNTHMINLNSAHQSKALDSDTPASRGALIRCQQSINGPGCLPVYYIVAHELGIWTLLMDLLCHSQCWLAPLPGA